jgi:hypothetical protein
MGKRLTRISGAQVRLSLPQLTGLEATIVLVNGSAFHGTVGKSEVSSCVFKDFRNHQHTFEIKQIAEIVTDKISSY